jgi:CRISPR/Cas system-associated exonuclease Cas4 (RecB family)
MPKKYQSPTSINTYLRCPRKYYLRYIKGLKSKPSIHLIRGKAVHETIAQFIQNEI